MSDKVFPSNVPEKLATYNIASGSAHTSKMDKRVVFLDVYGRIGFFNKEPKKRHQKSVMTAEVRSASGHVKHHQLTFEGRGGGEKREFDYNMNKTVSVYRKIKIIDVLL